MLPSCAAAHPTSSRTLEDSALAAGGGRIKAPPLAVAAVGARRSCSRPRAGRRLVRRALALNAERIVALPLRRRCLLCRRADSSERLLAEDAVCRISPAGAARGAGASPCAAPLEPVAAAVPLEERAGGQHHRGVRIKALPLFAAAVGARRSCSRRCAVRRHYGWARTCRCSSAIRHRRWQRPSSHVAQPLPASWWIWQVGQS